MSMRERQKEQPEIYPEWMKKDSAPRQCKKRDKYRCVRCGVKDRTLILDENDQPKYILYLHGAHLSYLDPWYKRVKPIDGQRMRAMCPRCHKRYDNYWKRREERVEHERRKHAIVRQRQTLAAWPWLTRRFTEVR